MMTTGRSGSGPYIEITFDPQGKVTVEPRGFAGKTCHEATRELEGVLGTVTSRTERPEMVKLGGLRQKA